MNQVQTVPEDEGDDDTNIVDILSLLTKSKKLICILPIAVAVCAAVIAMLVPNVYKATTKILPPQQAQAGASALLAQLSGVAGAAAGAAGIKNPNDLYVGMLKSRTIADKVIGRFDLTSAYDLTSLEKARKVLEKNTTILSGKDGLISIEVEDGNKKLVASIANAYAEELLKLTKILAITEASKRRLFFERQLEIAKTNLGNAEMALKRTLSSHGVISVDSDSRAIVEVVSKMRAKLSAKEIQINSMRAFVTENNHEFKRAQEELISMRAELQKLENGTKSDDNESSADKEYSGLDNIKVLREVKYQQMLYELLSKQYEVARLDESKDASIIQVLDTAIEPERKSSPSITLYAAISFIISLVLTTIGVLFWNSKRKFFSVRNMEQWQEFKNSLRFARHG